MGFLLESPVQLADSQAPHLSTPRGALHFEASRTKRAEDFKARIVELRAACNSCHAAYQKVD
jgi:nitrate/TMAO reductase-like tetraheme cytochrome c subunit